NSTLWPLSSVRPGPTAMTMPSCGFSLAVSGKTMPYVVVRVFENISALLGPSRQECARPDERHVVRAFDEQVILVAGLAAFERSLVPRGAGNGAEAVERSGHAHVRQRDSIEGMIAQTELAGALRRKAK